MSGPRTRRLVALAGLMGAALFSVGCGEMTTRTWVHVIEEDSGGFVTLYPPLGPPIESPMLRLQGGFLIEVVINIADLPNPMNGSITMRDVRMAGEVAGLIGKLCTWNDPDGHSGGPLVIDVLGGSIESSMFLDAKATTGISELLGLGDVDFEEEIDMDLGGAFDMASFFDAFLTGDATGLFETQSNIASEMEMMGLRAVFAMNTTVTNYPDPPVFDADLLDYCGPRFAVQGYGDSHVEMLNVKSSYLRHVGKDRPVAPLVLDLAEVGAGPGSVLQLSTVGTYAAIPALRDGPDTKLGGVFSSTDEVLGSELLYRIPGAIDAGVDINTWPSIVCFLGVCEDRGGDDILFDFRIDPSVTITVPAGANYLVVAPIDGLRVYGENVGLGFGLKVDVLP